MQNVRWPSPDRVHDTTRTNLLDFLKSICTYEGTEIQELDHQNFRPGCWVTNFLRRSSYCVKIRSIFLRLPPRVSQNLPFVVWVLTTTRIPAKILAQLQIPNSTVPVEILAQAKPKEPPSDAFPKLVTYLVLTLRSQGRLDQITNGDCADKRTIPRSVEVVS